VIPCSKDHINCCSTLIFELQNKGYKVQTEYPIPVPLKLQAKYKKRTVVVDIYGTKNNQEVIIEVGYLSQNHVGERIALLKPNAKIIHVHQWKNYLSCYDFENKNWKRK